MKKRQTKPVQSKAKISMGLRNNEQLSWDKVMEQLEYIHTFYRGSLDCLLQCILPGVPKDCHQRLRNGKPKNHAQ